MKSDSKQQVLIGLIGSGIQRSLSPALHEHEADAQGLRCLYQRIDLDQLDLTVAALPKLLTSAQQMGYTGLNITYPCKQQVMPLLDELSDDARAIGAVNTVVFENGKRIGHNTDCWGFAESFRRGLSGVTMQRVVQLGSGGAGAAVANAALTLGTGTLTLFDLDPARAQGLATALCLRFGPGRAVAGTNVSAALRAADGLIHATPTGMFKHPGMPLPESDLHPALWVAEVVYVPMETELIRAARKKGCRTLTGGGMAVFQAVEAFRLFTGIVPDSDRMLRHFEALQSGASEPILQE
jgi:shikimate dehydrogenase